MPQIRFRRIRPKQFRNETFRQYLIERTREVADKVEADFQKTVKTWDRKPAFTKEYKVTQGEARISVGTDDRIYTYVSEGTRPHPIVPRRAKALRFRAGYTAKTMPGVIGSRGGGAFGDVVFAKSVMHRGTEARNFEKVIGKKWRPELKRQMDDLLAIFARASNHYAG